MTAEMDLGAPISSMELAHGGGTLSVTSGNKVHFLDILRYVNELRIFDHVSSTRDNRFGGRMTDRRGRKGRKKWRGEKRRSE